MINKLLLISMVLILSGCSLTPPTKIVEPDSVMVDTQEVSQPTIMIRYLDNNIIERYAMVDSREVVYDTQWQMSWPDMQDNASKMTTLTATDGKIIQIDQSCIQSLDPAAPMMRCDGSRRDRYLSGEVSNIKLDVYRGEFRSILNQ